MTVDSSDRGRGRRRPEHDILFEPVKVGPKVLRNRFYQVPHCTGFGTRKPLTQASFRGVRAEGGWGTVNVEWSVFSQDSDEYPWVPLRLADEKDGVNLALTVDEAHRHGAAVGLELTHAGAYAENRESRWHTMAPSQIASDLFTGCVPKAMDLDDIRRVQHEWTEAARRGRDLGFDVIYVYGGDSMLPIQFLSLYHNRRADAYGGSFENRARFWTETLELVRDAIGDDCAVAVRISIDGAGSGGLELEEGLAFVELADDLVDLWDVKISSLFSGHEDVNPSRFYPTGYQLNWTKYVRDHTKKPIVGVGRFTDPDLMASTIRSGTLDLIGAARPSIADPFLPKKIEEGDYDDIRECIGCNICLWTAQDHGHLACTQNATAGEEHRRGWHPERFSVATNRSLDVLVIGAGPAGMEASIVLAKRGFHRVHLVEAESELGGSTRWITRLPGLAEWGRVVSWRTTQLAKLREVELITGTRLTSEDVVSYGAELVICATGSTWADNGLSATARNGIEGADAALPYVLTPEQIMLSGKRPRGRRVVVYDAEGYFAATCLAELLHAEGYDLTFVTPFDRLAPICDFSREARALRRRFNELGFPVMRSTLAVGINEGEIQLQGEYGRPAGSLETDGIVLVTQRRSEDSLYLELTARRAQLTNEGVTGLHRVGDCVSPRRIADAIFDGHRLGREIDAEHPNLPAPHRLERFTVSGRESASDASLDLVTAAD